MLKPAPLLLLLSLGPVGACDSSSPGTVWEASSATAAESAPAVPSGGTGPVVRYGLTAPEEGQQLLGVEIDFLADGPTDLVMATWTPGSYLIREYARHLEGLRVTQGGAPVPVVKVSKNRWRIDARGPINVRYTLYAAEASVRTNWVSDELAIITGAGTFLVPLGEGATLTGDKRRYEVSCYFPDEWEVATALPRVGTSWVAQGYDELVDSPIVAGRLERRRFVSGGAPHELVLGGDLRRWDLSRATADVQTISDTINEFWKITPFEKYSYLNVSGLGRGGLEHLDSTLMMAREDSMTSQDSYIGWLGLVSHEYFHTWNGKRLRPLPLGPFDYEHESHTSSLWVVEGLTSYFDDLLLLRAGLIGEEKYLELLSKQIESVQNAPSRLVQSLGQSSFDAWIKYYRADAHFQNSGTNYYRKGAVVGFLFDAFLRGATGGERSLDDVLRAAFAEYSGERGYTPGDFERIAEETAGVSIRAFIDRAVHKPAELDFEPALKWFGLRWKITETDGPGPAEELSKVEESAQQDDKVQTAESAPKGSAEGDFPKAGHLGVGHESRAGRIYVTRVLRDSPAWQGGVHTGDELIAIDGRRVTDVSKDLAGLAPGERVQVVVARSGRLQTLSLTLGTKPQEWTLEVDPDAAPEAVSRRSLWFEGRSAN